jgi:hypothetical protein
MGMMGRWAKGSHNVTGNPDPRKFKVLDVHQCEHGYALVVRYEGCTNFEGLKVMVFNGEYKPTTYLDPHFKDYGCSPLARFRPDEDGWISACLMTERIGPTPAEGLLTDGLSQSTISLLDEIKRHHKPLLHIGFDGKEEQVFIQDITKVIEEDKETFNRRLKMDGGRVVYLEPRHQFHAKTLILRYEGTVSTFILEDRTRVRLAVLKRCNKIASEMILIVERQ